MQGFCAEGFEQGGGFGGFRLDDEVAAERVAGLGHPRLRHPGGLADHAAAVDDGCRVPGLPGHPARHALGVDRILFGLRQAPEGREVLRLHGVDGKKPGHAHVSSISSFGARACRPPLRP